MTAWLIELLSILARKQRRISVSLCPCIAVTFPSWISFEHRYRTASANANTAQTLTHRLPCSVKLLPWKRICASYSVFLTWRKVWGMLKHWRMKRQSDQRGKCSAISLLLLSHWLLQYFSQPETDHCWYDVWLDHKSIPCHNPLSEKSSWSKIITLGQNPKAFIHLKSSASWNGIWPE